MGGASDAPPVSYIDRDRIHYIDMAQVNKSSKRGSFQNGSCLKFGGYDGSKSYQTLPTYMGEGDLGVGRPQFSLHGPKTGGASDAPPMDDCCSESPFYIGLM